MHLLSDNLSRSVQLARRFLRPAQVCLALAAAAALPGCYGSVKGPVVETAAYTGPGITVDSTHREHMAVVSAPSGGWRCTLDQVREGYKVQRVYVTLRKPNPGLYNTQAIVDQQIGTTVPRASAVEIYARIIAFDDLTPEAPYHLAAKADGNPEPLPTRQRERKKPSETKPSEPRAAEPLPTPK